MRYIFLLSAILTIWSPNIDAQQGRRQWTEEEAWAWHRQTGIIKGFNEPVPAYPGMTRRQVLEKAAELGFNSARFWVRGQTADEQEAYIRAMADEADDFGMTISPVLIIDWYYMRGGDRDRSFAEAKKCTQQIMHAFANDKRIILWDIWNEPRSDDASEFYEQMDWIEAAVHWCREMSPVQPITASIFYWNDFKANTTNEIFARRCKVESMMDIHNFHYYEAASSHMKSLEMMAKGLKEMTDRPLVCTEAIARSRGSTFSRSFADFSQYHVHFYTWGLFICDMNWSVVWGKSTYEPYDPLFHDLLHPDGEPIDRRELDLLRNFHFAQADETVDPGAEITERWTKERAWKWMVCGPVKGFSPEKMSSEISDLAKLQAEGYNSLRFRCDYNEWRKDKSLFYNKLDGLLAKAEKSVLTVTPVLLTDDNLGSKDSVLADYVADIIGRYATNPNIQAWDIYAYPGKTETDTARLCALLRLLFRYARFEFPNQPLTATPYVAVKDFPADFHYKEALKHGRYAGWNNLAFNGSSNPLLCNLIWSLSDVISFSSNQPAPETGWLASIACRYGRPVFCTEWTPPDNLSEQETLDNFAQWHIFWYKTSQYWYNRQLINNFRFIPISTPLR
jgi:hypothetical protein